VYSVTVAFEMAERADQIHHENAPAHSAALVQAFLAKYRTTQAWHPPQPRFGSLCFLTFPNANISVEREEICECDSHTVHKVSQRHLTAD